MLSRPSALRWDPARGVLWFLEHEGGHRLRQYDGTSVVTLFGPRDPASVAGDFRDGADPRFRFPEGLDVGPDGCVYIADLGNHRVRRACAGP